MVQRVQLLRQARATLRAYETARRACIRRASRSAVHDLRLATRRAEALLTALGPILPAREIRRLSAALDEPFEAAGKLRDVQVTLQSLRSGTAGDCPDELLEQLRHKRRKLKRRLQESLGSRRQRGFADSRRKLLLSLQRRLRTFRDPARLDALLQDGVRELFGELVAAADRLRPGRLAPIHAVRVALKRFRYTVELLQPVLPRLREIDIPALAELQARLGDINDRRVARRLIRRMVPDLKL